MEEDCESFETDIDTLSQPDPDDLYDAWLDGQLEMSDDDTVVIRRGS